MKRIRKHLGFSLRRWAVLASILGSFSVLSGCTRAQAGALWGAGVGAMLGHDTESRIVGSAVGAGVGYVVGNELDRQDDHYGHGPYGHCDY